MNTFKSHILIASFLGFIAIILGAMGAHLLKKHLTPELLTSFETAVRYQTYHCFFLLITGILMKQGINTKLPAIFALIGTSLFSGSIYLWLLTGIKSFVHVTPFGGITLMLAWLLLGWKVWKLE